MTPGDSDGNRDCVSIDTNPAESSSQDKHNSKKPGEKGPADECEPKLWPHQQLGDPQQFSLSTQGLFPAACVQDLAVALPALLTPAMPLCSQGIFVLEFAWGSALP